MNQEEIIKQFESWADENHYALDRSDINKEIYRNILTRNALLGYQAALASKQEDIKQGLDDIQLSMSMFANKEDYLKAVEEQEHIERNQEGNTMNKTKVVVFNSTESFNASLKKDAVTLIMLTIAMSISWFIGSSFWSVVILSMFIIIVIGKISDERRIVIKSKNDAITWAMSLPDD